MTDGASFSWIGGASGLWDVPANWADITTGQTPSAVAPGSLDSVLFGNAGTAVTVGDNGSAASITVQATATFTGSLNAGSLTVGSAGTLVIDDGGTMTAGALTANAGIDVTGSTSVLFVTGIATFATPLQAGLTANNGGGISLGDVVLQNSGLVVYNAGSIELGTAGTAGAGTLAIDAGYTLSGSGYAASDGTGLTIIDNGLISATGLEFGEIVPMVAIIRPGDIVSDYELDTALAGTGTVEVQSGGDLTLLANAPSAGLTFQLDGSAILNLYGSIATGNTIDLLGSDNQLRIDGYFDNYYVDAGHDIAAAINGFNTTDTIVFSGWTITGAALSGGTIAVTFANSIGGPDLTLAGDYSGDSVSVLWGDQIVLNPDAFDTPSSGTGSPDSYLWIGGSYGAWNSTANWADVTAGQTPAAVAPGSLDVVTIGNAAIAGNASVAAALVFGTIDILNTLSTGTLDVQQASSLLLSPGASVTAGSLALDSAATLQVSANATLTTGDVSDDGTLLASGTNALLDSSGTIRLDNAVGASPPASPGTLAALNGGTIVAAVLTLGTLAGNQVTVDAGSAIEIGAGASAITGALAIAAGATLAGNGSLLGNIVDNGAISSAYLTLGQVTSSLLVESLEIYLFQGTLSGSGTIEVLPNGVAALNDQIDAGGPVLALDGGAVLDIAAPVDGGTIDMTGSGNVLVLDGRFDTGIGSSSGPVPEVTATVAGFTPSDTLVIDAPYLPSPAFLTQIFLNGTLDISFSGTLLAALTFAGDSTIAPATAVVTSDTYSWIATGSGDWNTASDWADITTGESVAAWAPTNPDAVIIGSPAGATIGGLGDANTVTFENSSTLTGQIDAGLLVVGLPGSQSASVQFSESAIVTAGTVIDAGTIAGTSAPGALSVTGTIEVGTATQAGTLAVSTQAAALTLGNEAGNLVDASNAAILIGSGTVSASPGLTIATGQTVTGSGTLAGAITNNGLIASTNLTLYGDPTFYVVAYEDGPDSPPRVTGTEFEDGLSGTGTVEVATGGTIDLAAPVTGGGLLFQLDGSAVLDIQASIAAGNTIDLIGNNNVIAIDATYATEYGFPGITLTALPTIDAAINGFNSTDTIIVLGDTITAAAYSAVNQTLTLTPADFEPSAAGVVLDIAGLSPTATFTVGAITQVGTAESQQPVTLVPCFAAGTRIATPQGEVPVERLREGDRVLTASGETKPIQWIGCRHVQCRRHPKPAAVLPVRIAPHAFGQDLPRRELRLSPDHAVFIDDVMIPVHHLINGTTIVQVEARAVTYYHIELPRHDVLLAEGLPVESYLETGSRGDFENAGMPMRLHPWFGSDALRVAALWEGAAYAPLVVTGPVLDAVRARLGVQAAMLGHPPGATQGAAPTPHRRVTRPRRRAS